MITKKIYGFVRDWCIHYLLLLLYGIFKVLFLERFTFERFTFERFWDRKRETKRMFSMTEPGSGQSRKLLLGFLHRSREPGTWVLFCSLSQAVGTGTGTQIGCRLSTLYHNNQLYTVSQLSCVVGIQFSFFTQIKVSRWKTDAGEIFENIFNLGFSGDSWGIFIVLWCFFALVGFDSFLFTE